MRTTKVASLAAPRRLKVAAVEARQRCFFALRPSGSVTVTDLIV
jgi:hypothetical protein